MSVPVAPKKSCYAPSRDNRNGVKNNNESILSLGDTNANQIMLEVRSSHDGSGTGDPTDEIRNANSREPENSTRFSKEFHQLQGFGQGLQAGPTGLKDFKMSSTVHGGPDEEHTTERGTDTLQTPWSIQGASLSSWRHVMAEAGPEVSAKRDADPPRQAPKDKLAKTLDNEELRRHSLERAGSVAVVVDVPPREHGGSLSGQSPQPTPLDSPEAPRPEPSGGDGPQTMSTAPSLGAAFLPADCTSEGKSVRHPKPSTSAAKETTPSETQMGRAPRVSDESTSRSAPTEPGPHSASAPKGIPSKPEAQLGQGKGEPQPEPKVVHPKAVQELKSTPAECVGCSKEGAVLSLERKGPGGKAQQETAPGGAPSLSPNGLQHVGAGRGRSEQDRRAGSLPEEGALQPTLTQGLASLAAADKQPAGKVSAGAARKPGEMASSAVSSGDGQVPLILYDPPDRRPSEVSEARALDGGHVDSAAACTSDPCVGESNAGVPEPLDPQGDSPEGGASKEVTAAVAGNRNLLESAAETESTPGGAGALRSAPAPLHPETTANVTHQPTPASSSSFQDSGASGAGARPPPAAVPPTDGARLSNPPPKVPDKSTCPSGVPEPVLPPSEDTPPSQDGMENHQVEKAEERTEPKPIVLPKPKHVRPKIITYIRRSPQALSQVDTSLVPVGLPYAPPTCPMPLPKEEKAAGGDLYEKFKPDLQKPRVFSSGLMVSGIKPPGHHFSQMSEKFLQEVTERPGKEEFCSPSYTHYEVPPTFYRSAMLLKPQLGLGAMSRLPSAKSRILIASQRSSASAIHPPGPIAAAAGLYSPDSAADLKKASGSNAAKSNLPKSGLRPPGYSRLPAAKLAAFGFVRSSSVSSVSSTQSADSAQPEQSRLANRSTFGNEDQPAPKAALPSKDAPKGASRATPPASSSVTTPRRSLLPAPKSASIPAGSKKEVQKDQDANKPAVSSPKRTVAATTKLHSPGYPKQRTAAPRNGFSPKPDLQVREAERQLVQRLKDRCQQQARQLVLVQAELRRAVCGFQALAVSTQYFSRKNESALVKEKELSVELANVRDEVGGTVPMHKGPPQSPSSRGKQGKKPSVSTSGCGKRRVLAFNAAKCEKLQKEKEDLEWRFEEQVRELGWRQQAELQDLEERLQVQYQAEAMRLQEAHHAQLLRIERQHQEQVEDITASHEAAVLEMENNHTVAIAILQDDHHHKVQELMSTHELEKKELEENFEKLRLSLQDQVHMLTFQSQSLRDRARRFEEALRKNTEEQLEIALAPYQHLEEDMKSLKQVLEMKNQQIHQQEKKIIELEKLAEKNIILEEKIQVLQQQNEDLKARIDQNTVVTRQLSEENANLQEYVEKETQEKKRLSRTNEELLWKLQTGDPTSPVKLSPTSPVYRGSSSGPSSPARVSTTPR